MPQRDFPSSINHLDLLEVTHLRAQPWCPAPIYAGNFNWLNLGQVTTMFLLHVNKWPCPEQKTAFHSGLFHFIYGLFHSSPCLSLRWFLILGMWWKVNIDGLLRLSTLSLLISACWPIRNFCIRNSVCQNRAWELYLVSISKIASKTERKTQYTQAVLFIFPQETASV